MVVYKVYHDDGSFVYCTSCEALLNHVELECFAEKHIRINILIVRKRFKLSICY